MRGNEALLNAVRRCWASAFNERVIAYRKGQGQQSATSMAVLVQRLVRADAAGVAFTANPVTGDRSEAVVSSVRGLSDRLVSGQASPDEWRVRGNNITCQSAPEKAISGDQVRAVAEMARRVEAHYGPPQDIEWAIAEGRLFLLQARPITALPDEVLAPVPVPVEPPPGYWEREGVHAPKPSLRMWQSLIMETRNAGFRQACREIGILSDGVEWRVIGGWEYRRQVPPGGKDRHPPIWLMPILARIVPSLRSRVKGFIELVRSEKELPFIRLWHGERKQALTRRIAELRNVDLSRLSDAALDDHISSALVPFFNESFRYHLLLNVVFGVSLIKIVITCRELLGWDDPRIMELLSGLSEKSSEPARRLARVASMAAKRPAIRALLERVDDGTVYRLAEADPEFARAFDDYRREFGCRALQYSFHEPTLAETPVLLLGLVRDQVARGFDPTAIRSALDQTRAAAVSEARAALAGRPAEEKQRFERALANAELAYPLREDNVYYTDGAPRALIRYALLELGSRLAKHLQIRHRDDVFFLELDEACSAFREGTDLRELVAHRKAEVAWVEVHPGPASYGKDPGPPPLAWLPADAQRFIEGQLWIIREVFETGQDGQKQATQSTLDGIPASPGRYSGPARVIMSESEFGKLHTSDVLVCPTTSPVWSILFPSIGALITDTGGMLSHPAIIAREYRVPAAVATGNATRLLHDGQTVTVDGRAGTVEVMA